MPDARGIDGTFLPTAPSQYLALPLVADDVVFGNRCAFIGSVRSTPRSWGGEG